MKDVAVLIGGTFNPITKAHIELGKISKKIYKNADIFYIPCNMKFISKWKKINNTEAFSDENRIKLLKNVFKNSEFNLSMIEINGDVNGRTYDSVRFFKTFYKKVVVVLGADKLTQIDRWENVSELMENADFILFDRQGEGFNDLASDYIKSYSYKIKLAHQNDNYQNISSTSIRKAFKENKLDDVKEYIPIEVYNYLKDYKEN